MTNETVEHKRIKEIVLNKLKEFCAAGLTEYPHSGNVNDVHLVTSDNIDIFTENVWTSTKSNFYRHMTILQRSPADAKILIVNPQILRDSHLQREFEKTKISETKRGIAVADLTDGSLTLKSQEFVNEKFKKIVEELVAEVRCKKGAKRRKDGSIGWLEAHHNQLVEEIYDKWFERPSFANVIMSIKTEYSIFSEGFQFPLLGISP